jgi:uncharacterized membrane protein (UPF0136 family)
MSQPSGSSHVSLTMAALVTAGGVAGYVKAGSTTSLAVSSTLGAAFASSAFLIHNGRSKEGHVLAATASAVFASIMVWRWTNRNRAAGKLASQKESGNAAFYSLFGAALGLVATAYEAKKAWEWIEADL